MEKQNLFTEEELAKVTDETERKHLIECTQDQSKIDMKYMEIMSKYDLWEKGKRSRYFHATTHENAKKIMQDGVIRKGMDGGVYICKQPLEAARFVAIRGYETGTIFEVELEERKIVEAHDHKKTIQGVQCTKVQAIQIGIEYEFYCETWKEEHDFFFKCFVQKHKIFPTKEEMIIRPQDDVEMSDEDAMRMQMAMSAMKDKSMTQRIEG